MVGDDLARSPEDWREAGGPAAPFRARAEHVRNRWPPAPLELDRRQSGCRARAGVVLKPPCRNAIRASRPIRSRNADE